MSYTEKDVTKWLHANPDLQLSDSMGALEVQWVELKPLPLIACEHDLQVAVIAKCAELAQTNPLYELIYAIPNGGWRGKSQGGKLKAEGVKAGMPDLHLPVARHGRHSLYLELKFGDNKPSKEQQWWIRRLRVEGHCVEVIWDNPDEVMKILDWYINR